MNNKLTIKQQIRGLETILSEHIGTDIAAEYVIEKLEQIREGAMCFHPNIIEKLEGEGVKKVDVDRIYDSIMGEDSDTVCQI